MWMRALDAEAIKDLLRTGPCVFVVIDYLSAPLWIDPAECFQFWRIEVQAHLCDTERIYLNDYPTGYCYSASEWCLDSGDTAVVLQKHHRRRWYVPNV